MNELPHKPEWLIASGKATDLFCATDWSKTPLGPQDQWPASMRTAIGICLNSRFPMFVWLGPQLVNIYNDAYIPALGKRHPQSFGKPGAEIWQDIWPILEPQVEAVLRRGEATWNERVLLVMERNGYSEDTYFTWSYSPISDESGSIIGLFCACTEETKRVEAEQQRDQLELERREREHHYRHAEEISPQMPWLADASGKITEVSPKVLAWTGLNRADLMADGWINAIYENDRDGMVKAWMHSIQTGDPYDVEHRTLTADGQYKWMRTCAFARRGEDGKVVRWYGTTEDIHLRKTSQESAREADLLYRSVFEATDDALVIYTPQGVIAEVNPAACQMYGFPREQMIGLDAHLAVHPDALSQFKIFLREAAAGLGFHCETVDRRVDGTTFPIEVVGTSLDYNGQPHVMSMIRDITQRTQAVNRVRRLYDVAAKLSEALTTADVASVAVTYGIAALGASAGTLGLLSQDELFIELAGSIGFEPHVIDPWKRIPISAEIPLADAMRRAIPIYLSSPEERLARYPALAHVTPSKPTYASASMPLMIGGKAIGVLAFSFDRQGGLSEADQEFTLSFSRQCAQALERARLFDAERNARAEAEQSNRLKDEFLATLSHELRTPLNAILGWSQIIRLRPANSKDFQHGLAVIERNARSQAEIIDDLLDMSRIISGKIRLDVRSLDLAAVVKAAVDTLQPTADTKEVRVTTMIDPLGVSVSGDPSRLQQIFWNLLSNAIKFTPKGGRLQVVLARVNSHVEFSVSDTGEGIDPEFLPYVFDRFRQADASTTRRHGGLGLGLSIVKQLVELHAGTVRALSPGVGKGATFIVSLPFIPVIAKSDQIERRHPRAGASTEQSDACTQLDGVTVLIIDDESDARTLIRRLLEDCNAVVMEAGSVEEAMEQLTQKLPAVIVSDIGMPNEDGYSLIRRVRALPDDAGGNIPAVALTAYTSSDDRTRAIRAGYQMHIGKPVEPSELIAVIASLAGRK